jgi:hypothetical protein
MHNHDEDSEACLSWQMLILSKGKQWRTCVKDHAKWFTKNYKARTRILWLIKDIQNISRNIHTARSSELLPLPTDIEETHEALNAVQVLSLKDLFLFVNDSEKKNIVMFSSKTNLQFLSSIDVLYVEGTFKSAPSFTISCLQFMDSATANMCHLHFSYWPVNIKRPMRMYSDIQYQRLQNFVWMFVQ